MRHEETHKFSGLQKILIKVICLMSWCDVLYGKRSDCVLCMSPRLSFPFHYYHFRRRCYSVRFIKFIFIIFTFLSFACSRSPFGLLTLALGPFITKILTFDSFLLSLAAIDSHAECTWSTYSTSFIFICLFFQIKLFFHSLI